MCLTRIPLLSIQSSLDENHTKTTDCDLLAQLKPLLGEVL